MPSPDHTNQPAMNPLTPVAQLAHWLTATTLHLAVGILLGLLAARAMRRQRLRWTWAATMLAAVCLGWPILGQELATVLGTAALCATVRGRRWHREDLEAGVDLAVLAAARRGPVDASRAFAHWIEWRRVMPVRRRRAASGRLVVGHEQDSRAVSIPFGDVGSGTHTLVVGATRSGKTVTMAWMAAAAIERGMGVIVVDPKGDRELRRTLRESTLAADRSFVEWSPDGSSAYNPYARGSETEIADKALAGERFTEPHYLRQAQRYLGHEVRVLRLAGLAISPRTLLEHLDPARLEALARDLSYEHAQEVHDYLDALTARQRSDLAGVRDRLAILVESDIGQRLDPRVAGARQLDLLVSAQAREAVYFNLEADRRPLLAQMLGAAIVQDLQTLVAALQGSPTPTLVVIDEFSAIAPERVVGLFARAAGAGVSLALGTQELADLRPPGAQRLLDQVLGNLSTLIAHRQAVPASAELISGMTETRGVWRTSRHGDGRLTRTRGLEHALRAEQVTRLQQGWAAVIDLLSGGRASTARICSPVCHSLTREIDHVQ